MSECSKTVDLDVAVAAQGGGKGCMRGLPLSPMLKVALRNMDYAHAHSEPEARESYAMGVSARTLKRLRELGLADVVVERETIGPNNTQRTVRRHWLTPEGVEARRAMDA